MSDIIDYNPFAGDGGAVAPHRPSLAQLGGGAYQDDQSDPPDPDTMPTAAMENVNQKVVASMARLSPVAIFSVRFVAGVPTSQSYIFADDSILAGDITLTDNGNGDTSITWPADTFPVAVAAPWGLTMNEINTTEQTAALAIANGIRVHTRDNGGTGVDTNFTVCLS